MLERLLPICERRGLEISLYPHARYGMQTTTEAVALCREFNHPRLNIVFNGYHWYATEEHALEQRLDAMWPWLKQVNIAGTRRSPLGWESMGGDVYGNLRRSVTAFRSIEQRLAAHPEWAVLTDSPH
jgi:sugar phosphate isomerase/epimerase